MTMKDNKKKVPLPVRSRKIHRNHAMTCEGCGTDLMIGNGVGEYCPKCDGVKI